MHHRMDTVSLKRGRGAVFGGGTRNLNELLVLNRHELPLVLKYLIVVARSTEDTNRAIGIGSYLRLGRKLDDVFFLLFSAALIALLLHLFDLIK